LDPTIHFECAWVLTNIASGESSAVEQLVDFGVIPALVSRLETDQSNIVEQCVWALGNISGDSVQYRDLCLRSGIANELSKAFERLRSPSSEFPVSLLRIITWVMSNIVR